MAHAARLLAAALVLSAVAEAAADTSAAAPGPAMITVTGVVRLPDEKEGPGKKFRGVLLEEPGGQRWVLGYQRDLLWAVFDERTVAVTGERYTPPGQALVLPHLRPHAWKAADEKEIVTFIEVKPEETLEGTFSATVWPKGSKLAGEKELFFSPGEGRGFRVVNRPPGVVLGKPMKVTARQVVHSPFVAHVGGPALWVLSATPIAK